MAHIAFMSSSYLTNDLRFMISFLCRSFSNRWFSFFALLFTSVFASIFSPAAYAADLTPLAITSNLWALPFAGMLLSIALFPIFAANFWHHHYGKVAAVWGLLFLLPALASFGVSPTLAQVWHVMLQEYVPFLILLFTLYTVAGGVALVGNLHGGAALNTGLLALGAALAGVMGTTGAAMLLIRPLLRANDHRAHRVHIVIFFILLVANAGGGFTPLGDPPLFIGFLKGVSFAWTAQHMFAPTLLVIACLLTFFFLLDYFYFHQKNADVARPDPTPDTRVHLLGKRNLVLLLVVVGAVILSGVWKPGIILQVGSEPLPLENLVRDLILFACAALSRSFTPAAARRANDFNWGPIAEVAKLFAAIFLTIIPVLALLKQGAHGPFAGLLVLLSDAQGQALPVMYFWLSGILSAFLDNAPTWLVFFNLAGGDPVALMQADSGAGKTLLAISCGAVFMGALTYIGNAPNFMVKAIAEQNGIRMPSFFAYLLWASLILLPVFVLVATVFF